MREGTRRLALLVGVAGAIFGGFTSYLELQSVLEQRTRHKQFEQFATSYVVQQERKSQAGWLTIDPQTQQPIPWVQRVDKGGIETIGWSRDNQITSIVTQDGQTLYPTPAPSAWLYVLIALSPIFGFFLPWGIIRAIGWVGSGFIQNSN